MVIQPLGHCLQSNLKWNLHYDNIISNANKSLGFLKRNLQVSNTDIKSRAYQTLVRPKLEYSCSIWDPHTTEYKHKLEMVQRHAARYAMNNYHNTSSVTDMINTLQWPTLADRAPSQNTTSNFLQNSSLPHCYTSHPHSHPRRYKN